MSPDKIYTAITQVEECIDSSLRLWGYYYRVVNKSCLYNKLKNLYDSLPKELIDNKDFLNRQKEENIFTILNEISLMLEQSKTFLGFMIINVYTMTNRIDRMYASLPEDIKMCRKNGNIITDNPETIEIPDYLKK